MGEVSCEGGVHRDRALALRDVVALARRLLDDIEGELLRQTDLHGGGGGGDEGLCTLVDRHAEQGALDLTEVDGVKALPT